MENENLTLKNMTINPESEIIYSSSVGVGGDSEEIRLLLFNKRLISDDNHVEIINESNIQIILSKTTAIKLKELLEKHLED